MKFVISESQYNVFIQEEEKKPIPINDKKHDRNSENIYLQNCKKIKVPKEIIDTESINLNKTLNNEINDEFEKIAKAIDSPLRGIIKSIFTEIYNSAFCEGMNPGSRTLL